MDEVPVKLTTQDLQVIEALIDRALRQSGAELLMPAAVIRQKLQKAVEAVQKSTEAPTQ